MKRQWFVLHTKLGAFDDDVTTSGPFSCIGNAHEHASYMVRSVGGYAVTLSTLDHYRAKEVVTREVIRESVK